jgi:DNA-binding transcriptional ArsR family regulator
MKSTAPAPIDPRIVKALGHPLRQRILRSLNDRVTSPSELADELDEPLGNVSYHIRILRENDAIELVKTAPVRGAIEHFYRARVPSQFDEEHWSKMPASTRRALFDQTLQEIWDQVVQAAKSDGLGDERAHVSCTPMDLDDQASEELSKRLGEVLDLAIRLQADTAKRRGKRSASSEERPVRRTQLAILHFDCADPPNGDGGGSSRPRRGRGKAAAKR